MAKHKLCDAWDYGLNKCKPSDLDPTRGCIRDHAAESCFIMPNIDDMQVDKAYVRHVCKRTPMRKL